MERFSSDNAGLFWKKNKKMLEQKNQPKNHTDEWLDGNPNHPQAPMAATSSASAPKDNQKAIQEVLKEALINNGLARGLRETTRALDKRQAIACILAKNCDEENGKKVIKALCTEHEIPLIIVDDSQKLGEWAGLCEFDKGA